jgi:TonB-dependent SusC/RagA subfamily outer membrane receptor
MVKGMLGEKDSFFIFIMTKTKLRLSLWTVITMIPGFQAQDALAQSTSGDSLKHLPEDRNCLWCESQNGRLSSADRFDFIGLSPTNELSVYDYLQGRVSGLDIISASDGPGKDAQATLRGANLYGGGSPLIVIDGIPQISTDRAFNQLKQSSEDIRSLIPVALEDIQSIEVLKDGASLSLYGAEGADGVILIKTKKGGAKKLGLTYECNQSYVQEPSYFSMLNSKEYCQYQAEVWHNYNPSGSVPEEISFDQDFAGYYNYSANTDWVKTVSQPGYGSGNFLSLYGSNTKNRYYASVNYQDQKGTVINTKYNRIAGRLNFEHYFTPKLITALDLSYTQDKFNGNPFGPDQKSVLEMAFEKAPNMSIWEYDAAGNPTGSYFSPGYNYQGSTDNYFNPVAVSNLGSAIDKLNMLAVSGHIQYQLSKWLQLRETFTYNNTSANSDLLLPGEAITATFPDTWNYTDVGINRYRNQLQACFGIPLKNSRKDSLNGSISWIREYRNVSEENNYHFYTGNNMENSSVSESNHAIIATANYNMRNRYLLNAHVRIESTPNNKNTWDNFYGAAAGWRFSQETFMKNLQFPGDGMIRVSWNFSDYHPNMDSHYTFDMLMSDEKRKTTSFDVGADLNLWNNKIHLKANYYLQKTKIDRSENLDYISPLAYVFAGFNLNGKGMEYTLESQIVRNKNWSWSMQFNISHHHQYISKPAGYLTLDRYGYADNGKYATYVRNNKPAGSIYGFRNLGVYSTDQDAIARDKDGNIINDTEGNMLMMSCNDYPFAGGDTRYGDVNYDGIIDNKDLVYLGNSYPK